MLESDPSGRHTNLSNIGFAVFLIGLLFQFMRWPLSFYLMIGGVLIYLVDVIASFLGYDFKIKALARRKPRVKSKQEILDDGFIEKKNDRFENLKKVWFYLGASILLLGVFLMRQGIPGGLFLTFCGFILVIVWFIWTIFIGYDN